LKLNTNLHLVITLTLRLLMSYIYEGRSSQTGTFNFTGIKRNASVAVLHVVVSGKCVLLLIAGAHVAGQSRDR